MLNLLLGRNSKLVFLFEVIGVISFILIAPSHLSNIAFWLYLLCYLLIKFCDYCNWYQKFDPKGREFRERGIRLHFKKVLVPTSYIIFVTNICVWFIGIDFMVYIAIALLIFILHVNFILIYLHMKDKSVTPPNYFSQGM